MLDVPMSTNNGATSILSRGWIYLIALAAVTLVFCGIFIYLTVYDVQDQMLFTYVALMYAVFILYLIIVTTAYYLKIRQPAEVQMEIQNLRSTISDAFTRPRW